MFLTSANIQKTYFGDKKWHEKSIFTPEQKSNTHDWHMLDSADETMFVSIYTNIPVQHWTRYENSDKV